MLAAVVRGRGGSIKGDSIRCESPPGVLGPFNTVLVPAPSSGVLAGRKPRPLLCAASPEPSPEQYPPWVPLHQGRTQGLAVSPLGGGGMVWELGTAEGAIRCFVFQLSGCRPPLLPPGEHSSKRCGAVWLPLATSTLSFPRFGSRAGPVRRSSPENRSSGSRGTSLNRTAVWI